MFSVFIFSKISFIQIDPKSMKEYLSKELIWDPGIASLVRDLVVKVKHALSIREIKETSRKRPT